MGFISTWKISLPCYLRDQGSTRKKFTCLSSYCKQPHQDILCQVAWWALGVLSDITVMTIIVTIRIVIMMVSTMQAICFGQSHALKGGRIIAMRLEPKFGNPAEVCLLAVAEDGRIVLPHHACMNWQRSSCWFGRLAQGMSYWCRIKMLWPGDCFLTALQIYMMPKRIKSSPSSSQMIFRVLMPSADAIRKHTQERMQSYLQNC